MSDFSDNLKALRVKCGKSQKQLAEAVCVSQQAIHQWETGKAVPQADRLQEIADTLDCTSFQLLYNDRDLVKSITCDYTKEWRQTINYLREFSSGNPMEQQIQALSIQLAEQELESNIHMVHNLLLTDCELNFFKMIQERNPGDNMANDAWRLLDKDNFYYITSGRAITRAKEFAVLSRFAKPEILNATLSIEKYLTGLWR